MNYVMKTVSTFYFSCGVLFQLRSIDQVLVDHWMMIRILKSLSVCLVKMSEGWLNVMFVENQDVIIQGMN